jgi:hypothetical protein
LPVVVMAAIGSTCGTLPRRPARSKENWHDKSRALEIGRHSRRRFV